jgi:hypothetical protein
MSQAQAENINTLVTSASFDLTFTENKRSRKSKRSQKTSENSAVAVQEVHLDTTAQEFVPPSAQVVDEEAAPEAKPSPWSIPVMVPTAMRDDEAHKILAEFQRQMNEMTQLVKSLTAAAPAAAPAASKPAAAPAAPKPADPKPAAPKPADPEPAASKPAPAATRPPARPKELLFRTVPPSKLSVKVAAKEQKKLDEKLAAERQVKHEALLNAQEGLIKSLVAEVCPTTHKDSTKTVDSINAGLARITNFTHRHQFGITGKREGTANDNDGEPKIFEFEVSRFFENKQFQYQMSQAIVAKLPLAFVIWDKAKLGSIMIVPRRQHD